MEGSIYAYIAGGLAGYGLLAWRFHKRPTTFGSAGWLPLWTASRKRLFRQRGILVGDFTWGLPVYHSGTHAITFGPSGCGKGTSAILPNLLRARWVFLIDPGGENTAVAAKFWRKRGFAFYALNPWGLHSEKPWALPVHAFNPLEILDPARATFVSDADLLADMLVTRTGREDGSNAYFKDEAQSAIRAFLMHIRTKEPADRQNLTTLRAYISSTEDEWNLLLDAMEENPEGDGAIGREAVQLRRREVQASEEFSAILSTIKQDTNWLEDPVMRAAVSRSDTDFGALKGKDRNGRRLKGAVISVIVPLEYNETHAAYSRLALAGALQTMQRAPLARSKVLFLIDEAAALKRVQRLMNWLATLRKYRVVLWPVFQNIGQVKELYRAGWQTFLANAELKQFLGAGDLETAEYVSKLCGEITTETESKNARGDVSKGQARRPLLTPEEVIHLKPNRQIAFIGALKPLLLRKTPYWKRPGLRGRFHRNPYHARTPGPGIAGPVHRGWGASVRFFAWLLAPGKVPVLAMLAGLAWWQQEPLQRAALLAWRLVS